MRPIEDALHRLEVDEAFRAELNADPIAALRHYPLTPSDLVRLTRAVRDAMDDDLRKRRSA